MSIVERYCKMTCFQWRGVENEEAGEQQHGTRHMP
jgi:hypothetical protein